MSARQPAMAPHTPDNHAALDDEIERLNARVRELEASGHEHERSRLEQFAEAMGGWFWEMDEQLRFTYVSSGIERITGLSPQWHYGKTRQELGRGDEVSHERWREHLAALQRHERFDDFVFHRICPDGARWMRTSGAPVFDAQSTFQGYRGAATDVTSEVEARRTSELLLAAVENFDELFALWGPDDRLVMCNERFLELNAPVADKLVVGTSFESHVRAALAAGLVPQSEGREEEWIAKRIALHRTAGSSFEQKRRDGRWLHIREHRLPDGSTATICSDITGHKRASEQIARERDLLRKVVRHSPIILWSINVDGEIEVSEGRGLEAQGYQAGELVGRSVYEVYEKHPDFLSNVRRALAGEAFSAQNDTAGGSYERFFEPMHDDEGNVSGVMGISVDITELKRSERELAEKHRVLETALETIPDGVQVLDADLQLVVWNERLWDVLQLDGEAIANAPNPGKAFRYALASRGEYGEGDVDALVASREAIARTPAPVQYERQLVTGRWMECRGTPVPGGGYLAVYRDIDERKRMESELHRMATRDELTGLPNRRSLIEALESELERQRRYDNPLSVLLMDLDHFKSINDQHGHAAGDTVLQYVSKIMDGVLRNVDTVGRLGGEEFGAVLPETDLSAAISAAERVRAAVAALKVETDDASLQVTVSIGVTSVRSGDTVKDVLKRADDALYDAKLNGRDQVIVQSD